MKPKENIKLFWTDFQTNIGHSFKHFKATQDFSDVTLLCDDTKNTIEAHRIILSTGSSFFQHILSTQTVHHPHPLLYLGGVRKRDMEAILDFLYYGHTEVPQLELLTFLQTAKRLGIKGLQSEEELIPDQDKDVVLENLNDIEPIEAVDGVNKMYDEIMLKNNDKREMAFQGLGNDDLQMKVEEDMNEELALAFDNSQANEELMDRQIINFNPYTVLKRSKSIHSLVWKFFSFQGTKNLGPDTSRVVCSICRYAPKYSKFATTSNLILHLKLVHSEEFHSAKETESKIPTNEVSSMECNKEVRSVLGEEDKDKSSKTFNPYVVLGKTTSRTSLCWNFFSFKGTEKDGPDKSRVFCNLCPKEKDIHGVAYKGSTSKMLSHMRNSHHDQMIQAGIDTKC